MVNNRCRCNQSPIWRDEVSPTTGTASTMPITTGAIQAASDGDTVPAVRASFDRTASVDYIDSISGKDLEVTKVNDKIVVRFAYDKEIPLFGPAYLLIKYRGSSAGGYD